MFKEYQLFDFPINTYIYLILAEGHMTNLQYQQFPENQLSFLPFYEIQLNVTYDLDCIHHAIDNHWSSKMDFLSSNILNTKSFDFSKVLVISDEMCICDFLEQMDVVQYVECEIRRHSTSKSTVIRRRVCQVKVLNIDLRFIETYCYRKEQCLGKFTFGHNKDLHQLILIQLHAKLSSRKFQLVSFIESITQPLLDDISQNNKS